MDLSIASQLIAVKSWGGKECLVLKDLDTQGAKVSSYNCSLSSQENLRPLELMLQLLEGPVRSSSFPINRELNDPGNAGNEMRSRERMFGCIEDTIA